MGVCHKRTPDDIGKASMTENKNTRFKGTAITAVLRSTKYFYIRACRNTLRSLKQRQSGKETV